MLGDIWNKSPASVKYIMAVKKLEDYGYNVRLITTVSTSMHGSSESQQFRIYQRCGPYVAAETTELCQVTKDLLAFDTDDINKKIAATKKALEKIEPKLSTEERKAKRGIKVNH